MNHKETVAKVSFINDYVNVMKLGDPPININGVMIEMVEVEVVDNLKVLTDEEIVVGMNKE